MQQRPDFPLEKSDLCLQSEKNQIFVYNLKDSVTAVFFRLIRRLKIVMRYMQR